MAKKTKTLEQTQEDVIKLQCEIHGHQWHILKDIKASDSMGKYFVAIRTCVRCGEQESQLFDRTWRGSCNLFKWLVSKQGK